MRLAYFSPLPPKKSGIADYSEALLEHLRELADVRTFDEDTTGFDPGAFDATVYQIGNNPYHAVAYETALRHPGVPVLHEFNLHHLVAELTIKRGQWEAYLREAEYDGGPAALAHARRARTLEVGPDYEGVSMMRRILESCRAVIVHSAFMQERLLDAGFAGPVGRIPHGAWIRDADRMRYRERLGLDETTPLIGVFGFLKPYKRIPESLRAFRRLLRVQPRAKMVLVGEPHPDLPLQSLVRTLDLSPAVRVIGFASKEDFDGYLAACDIVLNFRYPTVGESSGTLLRALGMGKATLVSNVGSFCELPDEICLKVPVDAAEEDLIFQFLDFLAGRPEAGVEIGGRARKWAERTCTWRAVAEQYATFLEAVAAGHATRTPAVEPETQVIRPDAHQQPERRPEPGAEHTSVAVAEEEILTWSGEEPELREYVQGHISRLQKTLAITPAGSSRDRILDMGAYLHITPSLKLKLGYGEVRGCYYGPAGTVEHRVVISEDGEEFACEVDLFDAEKDRFPYPDGHFSTVLCCELIEHLISDPMHMMAEINRILRPGGHLVLTTPNISSLRGLSAILQGYHPGFFPAYIRPAPNGERTDPRHNREYTPNEIVRLLTDAGFEVVLVETGPFRDEPRPESHWVRHLLERYRLPTDLRGDGIYAVGRKISPVLDRYPSWLYN